MRHRDTIGDNLGWNHVIARDSFLTAEIDEYIEQLLIRNALDFLT